MKNRRGPQMMSRLCVASLLCVASTTLRCEPMQRLDAIQSEVTRFLSNAPDSQTRREVLVDALDARLRLSDCATPLNTMLTAGSRSTGAVTVSVQCKGTKPWRIFVPAFVREYRRIVTTVAPVARGETIEPRHITITEHDITTISNGYFTTLEQALGKIAQRPLLAGVALTPGTVTSAPLVHRGETITLVVDLGGLQVRTSGEALADAGLNEMVKIRNASSKVIVDGVVTAAGIVRVAVSN